MNDYALVTLETWTGANFLQLAAQFRRETPPERYTDAAIKANPYRFILQQRLSALAKAFDISPGFDALLNGQFIEHRSPEWLELLNLAILSDVQETFPDLLLDVKKDGQSPLPSKLLARLMYMQLAGYLIRAYGLLAYNGGTPFASRIWRYALLKTQQPNQVLGPAIEPLEHVVGLFIAPDRKPKPLTELRDHGWPNDDLRDYMDGF